MKASKEEACYQDEPRGERKCCRCTMFLRWDECTAVKGKVAPQGYCHYFEKKKGKHLREILESLSIHDAYDIFAKHGVANPRSQSHDELKAHHRRLMKQHHPDRGGNLALAKEINSAWDTIKDHHTMRLNAPPRQTRAPERPHSVDTPAWAWAGYSGGMPPNHNIYHNNYHDVNYIKKRMWELHPDKNHAKEHTMWQFDGRYMRGVTTVYGHEQNWPEMAKAMRTWSGNDNSHSIFVSKKGEGNRVHLIWTKEHGDVAPGTYTHHNAFNKNPGNDKDFMERLPDWIHNVTKKP